MKFLTRYDAHERVPSCAGESVKIVYKARHREDGTLELYEAGHENIYDSIQSHRLSCDINNILERFAKGDDTALSARQGTYGDFTVFPKTYAELLNQVLRGEEEFAQLPLDTRAKFNHSFAEWISQAGSADWFDKMGIQAPTTKSDVAPTAVPDAVAEAAPQEVIV